MTADPAAVARLVDQAVAQGLPREVEDPAAIQRVAAILRAARAEREAAAVVDEDAAA